MKARIAVERVHAAAIQALPHWTEQHAKAEAIAQAKFEERVQALLLKKSFFGGPKYNREQAEQKLTLDGCFETYIGSTLYELRMNSHEYFYRRWLEDCQRLFNASKGKAGFNIQLTEREYNILKDWL